MSAGADADEPAGVVLPDDLSGGANDAQNDSWVRDWGSLLRTARQIAGLSLTQLSDVSGLSKGYLSKLESSAPGGANPSRATLAALARALPSFRPLAHTLAPGLGTEQLDYVGLRSGSDDARWERRAPVPGASADVSEPIEGALQPIQLGWRELEVLVALMSLEQAALPRRITIAMLARATGRNAAAVEPVLRDLAKSDLVIVTQPLEPGGPFGYRPGWEGAKALGISRVGDLLILAAALISRTLPRGSSEPPSRPHKRQRQSG